MTDEQPAPAPAPGTPTSPTTPTTPTMQWVYLASLLLGVPLVGGGGAYVGNTQAAKDVAALEEKVDALDDKIDRLLIGFVRAHPSVPLDSP